MLVDLLLLKKEIKQGVDVTENLVDQIYFPLWWPCSLHVFTFPEVKTR